MNRNVLVLAGLALLLVGAALLVQNPFEDPLGRDERQLSPFAAEVDLAIVDGIEISAADASMPTELRREGSGWVVASEGDFPADTAAVGTVLRAVSSMEAGPPVSRSPSGHAPLEVDAASGVQVTLRSSGREVTRFVVGKADPRDFTTSYVRLGGADEVVPVRGVNRNLFRRGAGYRDRTLLSIPPDQVTGLEFAAADSGWAVQRGDTAWVVTGADGASGSGRGEEMEAILRTLSTLTADGFAQGAGFRPGGVDSAAAGLLEPDFLITVRRVDGGEAQIAVGAANERGQRYAIRRDRDAVYLVGEQKLASLRRPLRDLLSGDGESTDR